MAIDISDFTFVPDDNSAANPDGHHGTALVPLADVGYDLAGLSRVSVVDRLGRSVVFEGGGRTYFSDSAAGTQEFVGWSYFESEDTEGPFTPCVNLLILSPGYDVADYPGAV